MHILTPSLNRAMGSGHGPDPTWGAVMGDLWPIISSPLSGQGERLLLRVLKFRGRLGLDNSSEQPHSMSPEEMLKSLAVQALARWTGLTHLTAMERLEQNTDSSVLQSVVRDAIAQARMIR